MLSMAGKWQFTKKLHPIATYRKICIDWGGIMDDFKQFFQKATGYEPFPFQIRLATSPTFPQIINVPTGSGKTASVVGAWLWRRYYGSDRQMPRRLVYCLPMRSLVEQTAEEARRILDNIGLLADRPSEIDRVSVYTLMGGEIDEDWDVYPEATAILVGTQDMLLSRALNRGYGMSRYRWPVDFGLLSNDVLWVFDEVQLMGSGLGTSTQLQGLREWYKTYGKARSIWVSATVDVSSLKTIDSPVQEDSLLRLEDSDLGNDVLRRRVQARKPLKQAGTEWKDKDLEKYARSLVEEVQEKHIEGTLTLVVVNQVARAQAIYRLLKDSLDDDVLLIHSRFRLKERKEQMEKLLAPLSSKGRVVVATQAIEAGLDISATTMFTELAPWASMVQRFGRCNRYGTDEKAQVLWVDVSSDTDVLPYSAVELDLSRNKLVKMSDVGPSELELVGNVNSVEIKHVLRVKDMLDLFDTTPDLSGYDLDVSRFVREAEDNDVQVFWRYWEGDHPEMLRPAREELCSVNRFRFSQFVKKKKVKAWLWDGLEGRWSMIDHDRVHPGMILLMSVLDGGYSEELGWTGEPNDQPEMVTTSLQTPDGMSFDPTSQASKYQDIETHTREVVAELVQLKNHLPDDLPWDDLLTAAEYHDVGKAHPAFQNMIAGDKPGGPYAKGPATSNEYWVEEDGEKVKRKHFRHELVSALIMLSQGESDLAGYLAACHHGKVRLSIRSLPSENIPRDGRRFARGIWEGDMVPETYLDGYAIPKTRLSLGYMEMGAIDNGSGKPSSSWLERMLVLRDTYGPFRLAYLEALIRVADWRASRKGG